MLFLSRAPAGLSSQVKCPVRNVGVQCSEQIILYEALWIFSVAFIASVVSSSPSQRAPPASSSRPLPGGDPGAKPSTRPSSQEDAIAAMQAAGMRWQGLSIDIVVEWPLQLLLSPPALKR